MHKLDNHSNAQSNTFSITFRVTEMYFSSTWHGESQLGRFVEQVNCQTWMKKRWPYKNICIPKHQCTCITGNLKKRDFTLGVVKRLFPMVPGLKN